MTPTVTKNGAKVLAQRLAAMRSAMNTRGEVFMASDHARQIMRYHASSEPREVIPLRNPLFIGQRQRDLLTKLARQAVESLAAGHATDIGKWLLKGAETVRDKFRNNIAPEGKMNQEHLGLSAPAGQVDAEGEKMQKLSPRYAARKRKLHGPRPVLVATGEMRESIGARVRK